MSATVSRVPTPAAPGRAVRSFAVRPAHLATLVAQVSTRTRSRVIAVHVGGQWIGGDAIVVEGRPWRVGYAGSVLAVREALVTHEEEGEDARLVILTDVPESQLGWDVLARLARQRVHVLEPWGLVRELFRARAVDPRMAGLGWLADVLLEHAPATGYAPVASGTLDLDTAWAQALGGLLGLSSGAPDALGILRWSAGDGAPVRWQALAPEVRAGITTRFADTAGALGGALSAAIGAGQVHRLVAMGLVCDVLWSEAPGTDPTLRETLAAARVRLEPLVGGAVLPAPVARAWAAGAQRALTELTPEQAEAQRRGAESLLEELRAEACVVLSRVLPAGAARRAARLGIAIADALASGGMVSAAELSSVEAAHAAFCEHATVLGNPERAERATMAARLVRALAAPRPVDDGGFGGAVRRHVTSSSWIDAARAALLGGDVGGELARGYAALLRRAREVREVETEQFAQRLVAWNAHAAVEPELIPVERAIEQVVAPIAEVRPLLVLVLDGLDLVVWRQLHADLAGRGWTWWQPDGVLAAPVGIATLPSVTASSRASLFAGRARTGSQSTEKPDFAAHPALRRGGGRAPVLFHKGELGIGNALDPAVRAAIGDRQQRVVGAVINAVDDRLDRSDQVLARWTIGAVPLLDALLQEATLSARAVVVLSDHGHLLEHDTTMQGGTGAASARWRPGESGPAAAGEVLATGGRVREAAGQDAVVLAWSEALRYTGKKTGYHGGASPQEVVAPIAVLSRDDLGLAGWRPVVDAPPAWWNRGVDLFRAAPVVTPNATTATTPVLSVAPVEIPEALTNTSPDWIAVLLASPVYAAQRELAGRTAARDEQVRVVLATLVLHQARAPRSAIAAALGLPEIRVRGVLAGVRRLFNVEGFAVIEEEEATGTVSLNRELLRRQFGLAA